MAIHRRRRRRTEVVPPVPQRGVRPDGKGYDVEGQQKRTAKYHDAQEERDLVQCKVWVPRGRREDLIAFANELRS